jgi:HSP20 family molecular chaperone IbpA
LTKRQQENIKILFIVNFTSALPGINQENIKILFDGDFLDIIAYRSGPLAAAS